MLAALEVACVKRRRNFADLEWKHFREQKIADGRFYTRYWDEDGKYRSVYRYQWVWIKTNGPIPAGLIVHHKDDVCTNDVLENLELMTQSEHMSHHVAQLPRAEWICQQCGEKFARQPRGKGKPRKFCSQECHYKYGLRCETYEPANDYTRQLISDV